MKQGLLGNPKFIGDFTIKHPFVGDIPASHVWWATISVPKYLFDQSWLHWLFVIWSSSTTLDITYIHYVYVYIYIWRERERELERERENYKYRFGHVVWLFFVDWSKHFPTMGFPKASTAWVSSRASAVHTTTVCRATASCVPTTLNGCCVGIPRSGGSAPGMIGKPGIFGGGLKEKMGIRIGDVYDIMYLSICLHIYFNILCYTIILYYIILHYITILYYNIMCVYLYIWCFYIHVCMMFDSAIKRCACQEKYIRLYSMGVLLGSWYDMI